MVEVCSLLVALRHQEGLMRTCRDLTSAEGLAQLPEGNKLCIASHFWGPEMRSEDPYKDNIRKAINVKLGLSMRLLEDQMSEYPPGILA